MRLDAAVAAWLCQPSAHCLHPPAAVLPPHLNRLRTSHSNRKPAKDGYREEERDESQRTQHTAHAARAAATCRRPTPADTHDTRPLRSKGLILTLAVVARIEAQSWPPRSINPVVGRTGGSRARIEPSASGRARSGSAAPRHWISCSTAVRNKRQPATVSQGSTPPSRNSGGPISYEYVESLPVPRCGRARSAKQSTVSNHVGADGELAGPGAEGARIQIHARRCYGVVVIAAFIGGAEPMVVRFIQKQRGTATDMMLPIFFWKHGYGCCRWNVWTRCPLALTTRQGKTLCTAPQ